MCISSVSEKGAFALADRGRDDMRPQYPGSASSLLAATEMALFHMWRDMWRRQIRLGPSHPRASLVLRPWDCIRKLSLKCVSGQSLPRSATLEVLGCPGLSFSLKLARDQDHCALWSQAPTGWSRMQPWSAGKASCRKWISQNSRSWSIQLVTVSDLNYGAIKEVNFLNFKFM